MRFAALLRSRSFAPPSGRTEGGAKERDFRRERLGLPLIRFFGLRERGERSA